MVGVVRYGGLGQVWNGVVYGQVWYSVLGCYMVEVVKYGMVWYGMAQMQK